MSKGRLVISLTLTQEANQKSNQYHYHHYHHYHCNRKKHKKICASRANGTSEGGVPDDPNRKYVLVDFSKKESSDLGTHQSFISLQGGASMTTKTSSDTLTYQKGEFIVKCQGNSMDILIYNKERSFMKSLGPSNSPDEFNEIRKFAESKVFYPESHHPPFAKFFCYAKTTGVGLQLFIDKQAPWQNW